jgi:hypothetical protein
MYAMASCSSAVGVENRGEIPAVEGRFVVNIWSSVTPGECRSVHVLPNAQKNREVFEKTVSFAVFRAGD